MAAPSGGGGGLQALHSLFADGGFVGPAGGVDGGLVLGSPVLTALILDQNRPQPVTLRPVY